MKRLKKAVSLTVVLALALTSLWCFAPVAEADSEPTGLLLTGTGGNASYQFSGENALRSGYAEGTVTFDTQSGTSYSLYWADDNGVLAGYEAIATRKATGPRTAFSFARATAIPQGATALAVFSGSETALAQAVDVIALPESKQLTAETMLSFASVSDVHVNYDSQGLKASQKWTAALNWFDEQGMEYVMVSGDLTGDGTSSELQAYKNAIAASTFDADRIYEASGNHESAGLSNFVAYTSGGAAAGEVRPTTNSPYYYVHIPAREKGASDNLFIFMTMELSDKYACSDEDNWTSTQLDWVEGLLETYSGTDTNIFLVQHTVFHNFGPGERYNGLYGEQTYLTPDFPQNYRMKQLLMEYKEIVQMSGHTHLTFYQDLNFSDENGLAARMIHNSSVSQPRGYLEDGSFSHDWGGKTTGDYGSEGYMVHVTNDDIVYYGANLSTKQIIPTACFILESYSDKRQNLERIEITKAPDKTSYEDGDRFDVTGMVVTAHYTDGTSAPVKGYTLDCGDNKLSAANAVVTVQFGDKTTTVPISIRGAFDGHGTKDSPYLIQTAADFHKLTDLFNAESGSNSHDNTTYGAGLYFLQTADIDMTGYAGYAGTTAHGDNRYGFSGVYDGGGHTLTVNITSGSQAISIFPYMNGMILNLNVAGSLTSTNTSSDSTVQLIRAVGKYGTVLNCSSTLTLTAKQGRGLTYTLYGYVDRFAYSGVMDCSSSTYPITGSFSGDGVNGTLGATYYSVKNTSGAAITGQKYGISFTTPDAAIVLFNRAAAKSTALKRMQTYDVSYTAKDLYAWELVDGVARIGTAEPMTKELLEIKPLVGESLTKPALGDINGDGEIDSTDARLVLRYAVGEISLTEAQVASADVSGDRQVDSTDSRRILRYATGEIGAFEGEQSGTTEPGGTRGTDADGFLNGWY